MIEFFVGRQGWEVNYRGKTALPQDQVDDYQRRRDHSIETAVKVWMKDPNTILIYEGQHMAERHLAEQVTLISPQNEAVTILMDAETHLPCGASLSGATRSITTRTPTPRSTTTTTPSMASLRPFPSPA